MKTRLLGTGKGEAKKITVTRNYNKYLIATDARSSTFAVFNYPEQLEKPSTVFSPALL